MKKTLFYGFLLISFVSHTQEKDKHLPKGNKAFEEKNYSEAEAEYRISESKNPDKAIPSYNLGNAIYRQNQSAEAQYHYADALKNAKTRQEKHKVYHNLGNTYMKEKDYSNAVEAYKNALRNNPEDEETRYNFALAKEYLKNNPPKSKDDKSKDKNKDQKEQKEKNKEKDEDKDQNQNQKDKEKDKNENNRNNKEGEKNKDQAKPQPQNGDISKQRLENLLEAVNNEEKKIQDKVNKQKILTSPKKTEKDW